MDQHSNKSLAKVIDKEEAFCFKSYFLHAKGKYEDLPISGAKQGGEPDASKGLPTKGPDATDKLGLHHALL